MIECTSNEGTMMVSMACRHASLFSGNKTPFPAARPDAFMTTLHSFSDRMCALAASALVNTAYAAVGMACLVMKALEYALDPSS